MNRTLAMLAVVFGLAHTAFAADDLRCGQPFAPVIPDPNTATRAEFAEARKDVVAFIAGSDFYQDCLARAIVATKPEDERRRVELVGMIEANQAEKERLGAEYNAAAAIFNKRPDIAAAGQ